MTRLLVFGGTGFLGRHLVAWAVGRPELDVHATHLTSPAGAAFGATWHRVDILDDSAVDQLIDLVRPEVVVNAAYRQSGPDATEICSTGAATIAAACARTGSRLVHISTDLVFDGTLGRPYVEDDEPTPLGAYGNAKADAERRVTEAHDNLVIVRTSLIYGEPTAPQERLVRRAIDEGDIAFFTDEWRSPVHVRLLAAAVGSVAASAYTGILHVAGDERIDRLGFARRLALDIGLDPERLTGGPQDPTLGPRARDVALDCARSHTFGWRIPGPSELLGQC